MEKNDKTMWHSKLANECKPQIKSCSVFLPFRDGLIPRIRIHHRHPIPNRQDEGPDIESVRRQIQQDILFLEIETRLLSNPQNEDEQTSKHILRDCQHPL